MIKLNIKFN